MIKQSYYAIDIEKSYLLICWNCIWLGIGEQMVSKYSELVDMKCFQHVETKILRFIERAKMLKWLIKVARYIVRYSCLITIRILIGSNWPCSIAWYIKQAIIKQALMDLFSEEKNELTHIYGKLLTRQIWCIQGLGVVVSISVWNPLLKIDV